LNYTRKRRPLYLVSLPARTYLTDRTSKPPKDMPNRAKDVHIDIDAR